MASASEFTFGRLHAPLLQPLVNSLGLSTPPYQSLLANIEAEGGSPGEGVLYMLDRWSPAFDSSTFVTYSSRRFQTRDLTAP